MKTKSVINAVELQVSKDPVSVLRVRGNFRGATANRWLMFFDSITTPADGVVPAIPALPLYMSAPFFTEFEIGALEFLQGCYVCVSTTEGTKTVSADTMDISVELSDPESVPGTTIVGDLSSAVTGLQVWSEANGLTARKKLVSFEVDGTNLTTATQYIMLFATDTVTTGNRPISGGCYPIAVGGVLTGSKGFYFGTGRDVYSFDTVARLGCTIKISSTAGTWTACTGTACIRAEYI